MKQLPKYALILFAIVFALSSCTLIKVDEERDNAQIVAEFKGGTVLKGEAMAEFDRVVEQLAMYGITDAATLETYKPQVLDYLAKEKIIELKATEMNLMETSEEEKATIFADVEKQYNDAIDLYMDLYREEGMTDEEAREITIEAFENDGYTLEVAQELELNEAWKDRLKEELTKDVKFTEEDIETAFNDHVAQDEALYAEDPTSFENAMESEETVTWYPEGYRTEKHILIAFTDEQLTRLNDLTGRIQSVEDEIAMVDEELNGEAEAEEAESDEGYEGMDSGIDPDVMGDDGSAVEDESMMSEEELLQKKAELETEKADLEKQVDALKAELKTQLQPKVDEVMGKLNALEAFDALIVEYGEDPLMENEPVKTLDAYVSSATTDKEKVLVDAVMALEKVGDIGVSELGDEGIYIVTYLADVPAGPVSLDSVRVEIEEEVLTTLKNERYDETIEQWVEEAEIKTYVERMKKLQ